MVASIFKTSLALALLQACSAPSPTSRLTSVFNTPSFSLLSPAAASSGLAAVVGSLETVIVDQKSGTRYAYPICTGIQISPSHLLTASHCAQGSLIFDKSRIAVPTQNAVSGVSTTASLQFVTYGSVVRLSYDGDVEPAAATAETSAVILPAPVYKDTTLDFAVYDLPQGSSGGAFVDLRIAPAIAGALSSGAIWGFPDGVPLTSGQCHTIMPSTTAWLAHDCDALNGTSGGLIGDVAGVTPLAMHLAGPADNDGTYYTANGHFESPSVFALRRGCPLGPDGIDPTADCLLAKGYNRALPLATVRQELATHAAELWVAIASAAATGHF